jgi:hypothetical protein
MRPERQQRIEQLYHSALKIEETPRAAFLQGNCGGDESLRREVESLLAFLESPALELAGGWGRVRRNGLRCILPRTTIFN